MITEVTEVHVVFRPSSTIAMDEHDLMAASDDGTFVPFTDMLFNVVIGLAFMVFIAFSLINPTAKSGAVELKAELLITMNWPDNDTDDMDIYVRDPAGNIVWYHGREAGLMHLDHDDRGSARERYGQWPDDSESAQSGDRHGPRHRPWRIRRECTPLPRHLDQQSAGLGQGRETQPDRERGFLWHQEFDHKGQEETFVRFTLDPDGKVSDVVTGPALSLVRAVRTPAAGNGPK